MEGSSITISLGCAHKRTSHGKHLLLAAGKSTGAAGLYALPVLGNACIRSIKALLRSLPCPFVYKHP